MDATVHAACVDINSTFIDSWPERANNSCMNQHTESSADRLYSVLAERRIAAGDFAATIGESPQALGNWRSRGGIPAKKTAKVADALGLRRGWLETGAGERDQLPREVEETQGLVAEYALRVLLIERIIRASPTELAAVSRVLPAPTAAAVTGSRDRAGPPAI